MDGFGTARDWVGQSLLDSGGVQVGRIRAVYLDSMSLQPVWAQVLPDDERMNGVFVPLAQPAWAGGGVRVDVPRAAIDLAPGFDLTDFLSPQREQVVAAHYLSGPKRSADHSLLVVRSDAPSLLATTEAADVEPRRRFLHGRAPDTVALGGTVSILARIDIDAGDSGAPLELLDVPPEGADIKLLMHCPGFRLRSPQIRVAHVGPDAASEWGEFEIEAVAPGAHQLVISALRDGTGLGDLTLDVTVEEGVSTGPSQDKRSEVESLASTPGEASLYITFDGASNSYRFMLIDANQSNEEISKPLLRTPQEAVEGLVRQLNDLAQDRAGLSARATRDWLKGQGINLWDSFVPEPLQEEFYARQDRIGSLTIISSRDPVPWELLYPLKGDDDRGFLAERFPVMRWLPDSEKTRTLRLADAQFVLPDASPTYAQGEVDTVAGLLGTTATGAISDLERLLDVLDAGAFGALHFACHNAFAAGQPDTSAVAMTGGDFDPTYLETLRPGHKLRPRAPLVFMNACRSAGQAPLYTQLAGWASGFIKAGAGAFVGSLWEVRDRTAPVFAETFYEALLKDEVPLGQALQKARLSVRDEPGDPTWLAYTVYGHPAAKAV